MNESAGPRKETVTVHILGEEYTLKSQASPDYTRRVAEHVNHVAGEVRQEGGVMDPKKVAILTALSLADELFRQKGELDRVHEAVADRAEKLTRRVLEVVDAGAGE